MKKRLSMDSILREKTGTTLRELWMYNKLSRVVFNAASAIKSLTSSLTSFSICHKDIATLPGLFWHTWPNPSQIMLSTCKRLPYLSVCKTSTS